jgi:hypothetical protein
VIKLTLSPCGRGSLREAKRGEGFVPQTPHHRRMDARTRNFAKGMRREPTEAEAAMWRLLRDRRLDHVKFRRQVPFQNFASKST